MRTPILAAVAAASLIAVPLAQAAKPDSPGKSAAAHAAKPAKPALPATSKKCKPHNVAFNVRGVSSASALTKNADGTYDGTITLTVKRTNHHAKGDATKTVTYTLDDTRLKLAVKDANADGKIDTTDLAAGDVVKLHGKITKLAKRCDATGFTPATSFRSGRISDPKPPKAAKPAKAAPAKA